MSDDGKYYNYIEGCRRRGVWEKGDKEFGRVVKETM